MNRSVCLAILLTFGVLPCRGADKPVDLADNAALHYWRAMADSSWVDGLFESHPEYDSDPINATLDEQTIEALRRNTSYFRYITAGAACGHCEWALLKDGPNNTLLEHVQDSRTVVRMLVLRARVHFADGDQQAGIEDIRLLLTYLRHVATDNTHIGFLNANAHEELAIEVLSPELTNLSAAELKQLKEILDGLPERNTLQDRIAFEKELYLDWIRDGLKKGDRDAIRRELVGIAREKATEDASKEQKLSAAKLATEISDAFDEGDETVLKMVDTAAEYYREAAALVAKRDNKFADEYENYLKKLATADPITRVMIAERPKFLQFDQLRERERHAEFRIRMLKAAIDIAKSGKGAIEDHIDPIRVAPFGYVELGPQQFELSSSLMVDGKPYTILFGPQPKK